MGRRKRNKTPGGFVQLTWDMLNSRAYRDLSHAAKGMLPFFLGKVKLPVTSLARYMEAFTLPYSEARRYGCARATFTKVIIGLIDKGFVDPHGKGGLRSFGLGCNTFKLSQRWMKYGTPSFQSMKWEKLSLGKGKRNDKK